MAKKSCTNESTAEPSEKTAEPSENETAAQLRDIQNIVTKNKRGMFSSNIYCKEALTAMREKLQQTAIHNDPALKNIFQVASAPKKKAGDEKEIAKAAEKDTVVIGDSSDEECIMLSKRHVAEASPVKHSLRSSVQVTPVKHSRKTQQLLKKLESLTKDDDKPLWCTSDDSSDLSCLYDDPANMEEKEELELMVISECRLLRFTTAPTAPFRGIFEQLAEKHNVSPSHIILSWKEGSIEADDTPSSLGITPTDILQCIVRKYAPAKPVLTKNAMTIKFQCSNRRMTKSVEVSKDEPLLKGVEAFAAKAALDLSKIVLKFDGEKVDPLMTPDQLGIEDGECVDVSVHG